MTEISCQFYQYNPIINMYWTKNKNITDETVQCSVFRFWIFFNPKRYQKIGFIIIELKNLPLQEIRFNLWRDGTFFIFFILKVKPS